MTNQPATPIDLGLKISQEDLKSVSKAALSKREILRQLENIKMNADAKAIVAKLSETAVKVGDTLVSLGRAILTFVLDVLKVAPTTTFGAILGATLSMLVSSIPVLGVVLGPLLGPLLVAFGLGAGGVMDLVSSDLRERIVQFADGYRPLLQAT